jgi:hypothetical protein
VAGLCYIVISKPELLPARLDAGIPASYLIE